MKNLFKIGLAAFAALSLGVCLHAADGVKWLENFQAAKDQAKAGDLLHDLIKDLDTAARKGIISRNAAARKKSRMQKLFNASFAAK